jgi:hypothetical protein
MLKLVDAMEALAGRIEAVRETTRRANLGDKGEREMESLKEAIETWPSRQQAELYIKQGWKLPYTLREHLASQGLSAEDVAAGLAEDRT